MKRLEKLSTFTKFSFFVLAYNMVVILWGVFLRASKSGDGCGRHWLTCRGELIPSAPELKTVIEFSHRVTSGLAFLAVLALVIWAFRKYPRRSPVRKTAMIAFIFIVTEALVGAGLVLTGNTAETLTAMRPVWMAGHLVNTFILVASLTLTCWFATGERKPGPVARREEIGVLALGLAGIFVVGITGSIAALTGMIFPSESLAAGLRQDFSDSSHFLLRLRVLHPIFSIFIGVMLIFISGWIKKRSGSDRATGFWSGILTYIVLAQLVLGAATLLTGAPIVMQLGHLLLADAVWVTFVLLAAGFLSRGDPPEQGSM